MEEFKDNINYISNENIDENSKDESSCCYDYDREKQGQLLVLRIWMFERKNNSEIIFYNNFYTRF